MVEQASSKLIVVIRMVLLSLAAAAAVTGFVLARESSPVEAGVTYVCPMHPDVTSSSPGDCSICKMELDPKRGPAVQVRASVLAPAESQGEPHAHDDHLVDPTEHDHSPVPAPSASNGRTPVVRYVCPMHPDVTSDAPAKCRVCKMPLERKAVAPSSLGPASARAGSRSAASSVSPTTGAAVFSFHDVSRARARQSSRDMRAPAWLETPERGAALYFLDESELLTPGEEGVFFPSARPEDGAPAGVEVRVTNEPPAAWDASTALVRFEVSGDKKLEPKQTGWLKLATRTRKGLSVPYTAVVQSPAGPYVLVFSEDLERLTKRAVTIGSVLFGYASIVSGLEDGERVAAMRTYSLDALRKENEK